MLDSNTNQPSTFLKIPLEIRQRIYELHFFYREVETSLPYSDPHKFEGRKLKWAVEGLCGTAVNQIHPYRQGTKRQPSFELSIFRTNRQTQLEAEAVFYGWSSFNLIMDSFGLISYKTFEFLETLPTRYRRLIRRVEARCYGDFSQPLTHERKATILLYDWKIFMKFLAQECPSLQSLKLWAFADGREGRSLNESCQEEKEWVQAILQIKNLRFFDIHAIPRRAIKHDQSCAPEFVERLRYLLYRQKSEQKQMLCDKQITPDAVSSFPFLKLPVEVRYRIYRLTLLPADNRIHPYIKSWYDQTTRSVIPLFLTCHQIHKEAEDVLYGSAIFFSPEHKYSLRLVQFLADLEPRLRSKILFIQMTQYSREVCDMVESINQKRKNESKVGFGRKENP